MTTFFLPHAKDTTTPGELPYIEAEFLNWIGGFEGRTVARVRLRIQGKTKKRTTVVTLRHISRIVGDGVIDFAVFTVGTLVPPRWRDLALSVTHSCCTKQWAMEREQEAKRTGGNR